MTHNPLIKIISYSLYAFIIIHTVQGIILYFQNRAARKNKYDKRSGNSSTIESRNMALLGSIIFIFLGVHMGDFWWKMKTGALEKMTYEGYGEIVNLYTRVDAAYREWWIVLFYVVSMVVLAYHLKHGFQSAFQSLGINHPKYTPFIKFVGVAFSILIPLGFAIIPIGRFLFFK